MDHPGPVEMKTISDVRLYSKEVWQKKLASQGADAHGGAEDAAAAGGRGAHPASPLPLPPRSAAAAKPGRLAGVAAAAASSEVLVVDVAP